MAVIARIQAFLEGKSALLGPFALLLALLAVGSLGKDYLFGAAMLFRETVENAGPMGYVLYIGVFVVAALSGIFPLSVLAVLGGMIFGLLSGFILAIVGIFAGAAGAFVLGRYVFRSSVEQWLSKRVGLARLDSEIGAHGWKLVGLLRLSPFAPFSMASYAFSMTKIRFDAYLLGTIGVLPPLFAFVYTGSISSVALNAFLLGETELNEVQMIVAGCGFVATVVVALLFVRIARRALLNKTRH